MTNVIGLWGLNESEHINIWLQAIHRIPRSPGFYKGAWGPWAGQRRRNGSLGPDANPSFDQGSCVFIGFLCWCSVEDSACKMFSTVHKEVWKPLAWLIRYLGIYLIRLHVLQGLNERIHKMLGTVTALQWVLNKCCVLFFFFLVNTTPKVTMFGRVVVHWCCPGVIINWVTFHSRKYLGLDDKLFVHPNDAPCHAVEESHSLYCKSSVNHVAWISLCPQTMNTVFGQAREDSDILPSYKRQIISYHISPAKHKDQCRLSLHAEQHVAVSAGGKLRLEREKKCSLFFPLLLGGCFEKNPSRCPGERFGF